MIFVELTEIEKEEYLVIKSDRPISDVILKEITDVELVCEDGGYVYIFPNIANNCFVLYHLYRLKPEMLDVDDFLLDMIFLSAERVTKPRTYFLNETFLIIDVPNIRHYQKILAILNANHYRLTQYRVPVGRVFELISYLKVLKHPFLPNIEIEENVRVLTTTPLNADTSITGLFEIEPQELITVSKGYRIKEEGFKKLKYSNVGDIILSRPTRYYVKNEDVSISSARYGEDFWYRVEITSISRMNRLSIEGFDSNKTRARFVFVCEPYFTKNLQVGDIVYIYGRKTEKDKIYASDVCFEEEVKTMPISPLYKQSPINNITSRLITNSIFECFERFDGSSLAGYIRTNRSLWDLLKDLHRPTDSKTYSDTLDELAFIELVYLQLCFLEQKEKEMDKQGIRKYTTSSKTLEEALSHLSFKLTDGQENAIKECIKRLNTERAENILLSGDVGSGKTLIAQSSCLYTYDCGYQSVLIGPTEILARQLLETFERLLSPLKKKPRIAYLSSNAKAKEKKELQRALIDGEIDILVGTHSVMNMDFKNLGLVVIDEQQKFGTEQRERLLHSRPDGKKPDLIAQTATPIPRSTALAFYGNIDLISLEDKPLNRKPIITKRVEISPYEFLGNRNTVEWKNIFKELEKGHQVFIVTPAVEEEAKTTSAKEVFNILKKTLPKHNIACLHGKMKKDEQNKVIEDFREGLLDICVASSVVEVGVDIPMATVIVVLSAERFGASSLHQIRGRVGRNDLQSYCYLVSDCPGAKATKRLNSLVESNDGFYIALVDLETRKEGDLFGTVQSGGSMLRFSSLVDYSKILQKIMIEANRIYNSEYKRLALKDAKAFLGRYEE